MPPASTVDPGLPDALAGAAASNCARGTGSTATALSRRQRNSVPRYQEVWRLKRNVSSPEQRSGQLGLTVPLCMPSNQLEQGCHALDPGNVAADQPLVPARHDDLASVGEAGQMGNPGPSGRACGIAST